MTKYQPPVDMVEDSQPLPVPRVPAGKLTADELQTLALDGYTLFAGVRDGQPFAISPAGTKADVLEALQSILAALEALQ